MGDIVLQIVVSLLIPCAFLCLFLDKAARRLIQALLAGLLACLFVYAVDNYLLPVFHIAIDSYFLTTISPIFEELTKLIPLFILLKKNDINGKDVVSTSFVVGVGFSIVENLYFLVSNASTSSLIWIISRCIGTGLMHSISCTVIGVGLSYARKDRRLYFEFLMSAYFFATMYHGLFNFCVQSPSYQFIGILIPVISYLVISYLVYKNELSVLLLSEDSQPKPDKT